MIVIILSVTDKLALKEDLSDMDYLRSKVVKKSDLIDDIEDETDKEAETDEKEDEDAEQETEHPVQCTDIVCDSGDKDSSQKATLSHHKVGDIVCRMRRLSAILYDGNSFIVYFS